MIREVTEVFYVAVTMWPGDASGETIDTIGKCGLKSAPRIPGKREEDVSYDERYFLGEE